MTTIWQFLDGKKTYIAAAGLGLLALYHALNAEWTQAQTYALQALGFLGLRAAITRHGIN